MTVEHGTLVGRERELTRLRSLLRAAASGSARLALMEGEPGIGKSRILDELVIAAREQGFVVCMARAAEFEQERAFATIAQALGPEFSGHVPTSTPEPDAPVSSVLYRLIDRAVEIVTEASRSGPLLLVLDDLQWADAASLRTVEAIVRRLADDRVLVAGACRPIPRAAELARLAESLRPRVERLRLAPLDDAAVRKLSVQIAGRPVSDALARYAEGAGGNPFFIRELIAALHDDGVIQVVDGTAHVRSDSLPPSLGTTIVRRLGFLSEETIDLLRWAAVLGTSFSIQELAGLAEVELPLLVRRLAPAIESGVLLDQGDRLAFRHDLVREAVYGDNPRSIRAGLHLRVAQRRLEADGRALDAAPHFARGVVGRNVAAAEWMRRAAAEVAPQSPVSAVQLLRRGLEMSVKGDAVRDDISFDLVRALLWSGKWLEADSLAREVLEREGQTVRAAALRYVLGRSLAYRARVGDAIAEGQEALASPGVGDVERARLLADLSLRLPVAGDLPNGEAAAMQALEAGGKRDPLARRTALSGLALCRTLSGHSDEAVATARRALPLSDDATGEAVELVQPTFFLAIALIEADGFEEATRRLQQLRQRTDEIGMLWSSGLCSVLLADAAYLTGDWTAAVAEAETALEVCHETGTLVWTLRALAVLAGISARRGELERAVKLIGEGNELLAATGTAHLAYDRWLMAGVELARASGDHHSEFDRLSDAWSEMERRGWVISGREIGPPLVAAAVRLDRPDVATRVCEALAVAAAFEGAAPSTMAASDHCAGVRDADAVRLGRAIETYRQTGRLPTAARALEDLAALLLGNGKSAEARRTLEEALAVYSDVAADSDRRRVELQLRSLGIRRGVIGARGRPATGWASLTATEREIARLAGDGLTNREIGRQLFVSHRTVATHLAHIFGKVGLASRVELAAAVARGKLGEN